ncbi:MAG: folylpolyglutamate synthase/dihydrofolate synthase family protein [Acidobacteriaceae bacterium]
MSYAQAMEGLYALGHELAHSPDAVPGAPRRKFDLDQMRVLAEALGHPERQFRSVLIAGTNGKGSTAAMLASIVQNAGYRVGLYTSPHLVRVNERIQIDGAPISDDDFARLYFRVDETGARLVRECKLPQHPSFFETMTAVGFLYFAECGVDLAVLEVGMGGRLDATNIVEPLLSVITDISLDHTEWLGTTIAAITWEKAGILRRNGVMVTLPQHPEANQALGEVAVALNVQGVSAVEYMPPRLASETAAWNGSYPISVLGETVELVPSLAGSHQHRNIALAVAAAVELCNNNSYNISPQNIADAIRQTRWPGRLELFPGTKEKAATLLDVAHNPAGAWTLRSALNSYPTTGKRTLLFGCLRDKAFIEMAQILFPIFDCVLLTPIHSPRATSVADLLATAAQVGANAQAVSSAADGLALALRETPPNGLVVVAGSVYLIGELRESLVEGQIGGGRHG